MRDNPFLYVNSLYTFASDVATLVREGADVIAVTGPYDMGEAKNAIDHLLGRQSSQFSCLRSSSEIVTGDVYRGVTLVHMLDDSYGKLKARCSENGLRVVLAPTGVSSDELGGYGLALTRNAHSDSYRSLVLRLSALLASGSTTFFKAIVQRYIADEEISRGLKNPLAYCQEIGLQTLRDLINERSYAVRDILSFASFLASLANGDSPLPAITHSTYLWAWSRGMCWQHDGIWCPDWSLVSLALNLIATSTNSTRLKVGNDEVEFRFSDDVIELLNQICTHRVGVAEEFAILPVLERVCLLISSRLVCGAARYESLSVSACEVHRADQISQVRQHSLDMQAKWEKYTGVRINMYEVCQLRNCLCHLNPHGITDSMLCTLKQCVKLLASHEKFPYEERSTCVLG